MNEDKCGGSNYPPAQTDFRRLWLTEDEGVHTALKLAQKICVVVFLQNADNQASISSQALRKGELPIVFKKEKKEEYYARQPLC